MARILTCCLLLLACVGSDLRIDRPVADSGRSTIAAGVPAAIVPDGPRGADAYEAAGASPADRADVPAAGSAFGRLIQALSEPGGYFPSDNLVSNETSYLHVLPTLVSLGVSGGAYVGVGPDQNFSYIAHVRPAVAFIIDIRRDNLLHQLLFKAAFERARNRLEYLALILGRPVPADPGDWDEATLDEIVLYMDTVAAPEPGFEAADAELLGMVEGFGYPLTDWDLGAIRSLHSAFWEFGLGLRYSTDERRWRRYPTWRQLLLQTDLEGRRGSYLSSEALFRRVKRMQMEDRVVPVVGDLGGPYALAAIGREIADRGLAVSVFYVSNVEQYLVRGPGFGRYAATVSSLPMDERSVIIRSYFARRMPIPQTVPGHLSTQLVERMVDFAATEAAGGYLSYIDLVTRNALPLVGQAVVPGR